MSEENHPLKSSSGTAGLVAIIVTLIPQQHRNSEIFLYALSVVPPFMVLGQNWCWKNGAQLKARYDAWQTERELRKVLKDPLISDSDKGELKSVYSKSKTKSLLARIDEAQDLL